MMLVIKLLRNKGLRKAIAPLIIIVLLLALAAAGTATYVAVRNNVVTLPTPAQGSSGTTSTTSTNDGSSDAGGGSLKVWLAFTVGATVVNTHDIIEAIHLYVDGKQVYSDYPVTNNNVWIQKWITLPYGKHTIELTAAFGYGSKGWAELDMDTQSHESSYGIPDFGLSPVHTWQGTRANPVPSISMTLTVNIDSGGVSLVACNCGHY